MTTKIQKRKGLNRLLFWLYEGEGKAPFMFRWTLLILDFVSIAFFLWEPFHSWRGATHQHWLVNLDIIIAIYITVDFAARMYIASDKLRFFRRLHNIADVAVVITLLAPVLFENLNFLRILRVLRILRAFTFIRRAEEISDFLDRHRRVIDRVTNFVVFLFIMSAAVFVNQVGRPDSQIHSQLDALYFTVTSLTTTGYGDILMQGPGGRILAIIIMILGLTLFVRMLQSIVSGDNQIDLVCKKCGWKRHDHDALHCKRCGAMLRYETEEPPATDAENKASA